jgi:hypothetical protein
MTTRLDSTIPRLHICVRSLLAEERTASPRERQLIAIGLTSCIALCLAAMCWF